MSDRKFLKRLQRELPMWVERGWVREGADRAILEHVAAQSRIFQLQTYAVAILGALLVGAGMITFIAANWSLMPKAVKLLILFGSMWGIYAAAGHLLSRKRMPHLGQALLLLGVIAYGANIMLIAQTYHIDSHFPNGVMLWALGALLTAYLTGSQAPLVAALVLGTIWSGLESVHYDRVHWQFLLFWTACWPLIYRRRMKAALHVSLIALYFWSIFVVVSLDARWSNRELLYLMEAYFIAYLAVFVLGMVLETYEGWRPLGGAIRRYGILAALLAAYALTYPRLHAPRGIEHMPDLVSVRWIIVVSIALGVLVTLAWWHRTRTSGRPRAAHLVWGQWLIGALVAALLANLFFPISYGGYVALVFNIMFFMGLVWLVYAGLHENDRFLANTAFAFFGISLVTRYFDTFWSLLNRSYFFMLGGMLLIGAGFILERQRRHVITLIGSSRVHGGKA